MLFRSRSGAHGVDGGGQGLTQAIENDVDIMVGIEFEVDEIGNIVN